MITTTKAKPAMEGRFYHEKGRPGLSTRLMAGLHLLKHMESLSDEAVCARWVENPCDPYFCGEQYFRHKLPLDRTTMTRWRGRTGVAIERAYVDRGDKGHKHGGQARSKAKDYIAHTPSIASPTIRRELRQRNAIAPITGYTRSDGLLERNHLAGATGDAINAILVTAGHNLRLLVAWLTVLLRASFALWLLAASRKMLQA